MSGTVKLLVVDDHPIVREGLRALLSQDPRIEVTAEAGTAESAWAAMQTLVLDVILLDINLPGGSGLELLQRIKRAGLAIKVLMLTMHIEETYFLEALQFGASGYVLKGQNQHLIVPAIHTVMEGGSVVDTDMLRRAVARTPPPPAVHPELTDRENDVLKLLAQGHSNRMIAEALHLAEVTVKKHLQSLMRKLDTADRTQTAMAALRQGLVK